MHLTESKSHSSSSLNCSCLSLLKSVLTTFRVFLCYTRKESNTCCSNVKKKNAVPMLKKKSEYCRGSCILARLSVRRSVSPYAFELGATYAVYTALFFKHSQIYSREQCVNNASTMRPWVRALLSDINFVGSVLSASVSCAPAVRTSIITSSFTTKGGSLLASN